MPSFAHFPPGFDTKVTMKEKGNVNEIRRGGGGRGGRAPTTTANEKLEQSIVDGDTSVKTLGKRFGQALVQARNGKGMNQKTLAQRINEKPSVVQQYEQGRAVPNPQVITKMEQALGCRLPRK